MPAENFRELKVFQKTHQFVLDVYRLTARFPREEMFALTSQLRRAATSMPANIAEGFVKRGVSDKLRFYNMNAAGCSKPACAQSAPIDADFFLFSTGSWLLASGSSTTELPPPWDSSPAP